jgi:hypothetical protein
VGNDLGDSLSCIEVTKNSTKNPDEFQFLFSSNARQIRCHSCDSYELSRKH